jgi:hypothetical protein
MTVDRIAEQLKRFFSDLIGSPIDWTDSARLIPTRRSERRAKHVRRQCRRSVFDLVSAVWMAAGECSLR